MKTIIYGYSDDLIEIDGELHDELDIDCDKNTTITASDNTKANIYYDDEGNWRFDVAIAGSLLSRKVAAVGDDDKHSDLDCLPASSYSDVLVFLEGIEWIKIGRKIIKKH